MLIGYQAFTGSQTGRIKGEGDITLTGDGFLLKLKTLEQLVDKLEGEDREQLQRWLIRQQGSILHAMEQTRVICIEAEPYWRG